MKERITQILVCLALITGQSFYLPVCADATNTPAPGTSTPTPDIDTSVLGMVTHTPAIDTSAPDMVALAQPPAAEITNCKNALLEQTGLTPVNDQFIPGAAIYAANFSGDEANRLAKDGVYISGNSCGNYLDLEGGNILLNPEIDMTINTQSGTIYVDAGAITFIVDSGKDVVVYDLLQTKPKQVYTMVNKHKLFMEPGRMLVLTGQSINDFEKLEIDCHRVAYRNAQSLDVSSQPGNAIVFAADFSIASAMTAIQPLKRLTVSQNREDKIAVEKMLKGAVLLGDFATNPAQPVAANYPVTTVQADPIQVAADQGQ